MEIGVHGNNGKNVISNVVKEENGSEEDIVPIPCPKKGAKTARVQLKNLNHVKDCLLVLSIVNYPNGELGALVV